MMVATSAEHIISSCLLDKSIDKLFNKNSVGVRFVMFLLGADSSFKSNLS